MPTVQVLLPGKFSAKLIKRTSSMPELPRPLRQPLGSAPVQPAAVPQAAETEVAFGTGSDTISEAATLEWAKPVPRMSAMSVSPPMTELVEPPAAAAEVALAVPQAAAAEVPAEVALAVPQAAGTGTSISEAATSSSFILISPSWDEPDSSGSPGRGSAPYPWPSAYHASA